MELSKYLTTYHYDKKIRLGNKGDKVIWGHTVADGGYVIADIKDYDCYISVGVNDEESFSRDFINYAGMKLSQNYAFDGTIDAYPHKYTSNIHFVRKNVTDKETENTTNLRYLFDKHKDIFLKMDIEGGEYLWMTSLTSEDLLHFKQLAFEVHCPTDDSYDISSAHKVEFFKKLAENHYLIHVHANNNGLGWGKDRYKDGLPTVMELTYIRKDCVIGKPELNSISFPIPGLDYKNAPYEDMIIDYPPFVFTKNT